MGLDAIGDCGFKPAVKLLLDLCLVVSEGCLPPVESLLAGHGKVEGAGDGAVFVQGEVAVAQQGIGGVGVRRRTGGRVAVPALADAGGAFVLPMHGLEGTHLLAGIEEDLFAAGAEDNEDVVELVGAEVAGIEDAFVAIDHLHGDGVEACGAQHGDVEQGDVVARAALLRPGVLGALGGFQVELLEFGFALLAGEVRVVKALHGLVELLCLVQFAVAGGDETFHCLTDGLGGFSEMVHVPGPPLGLGLPEVDAVVCILVIEVHVVAKAASRRHPLFVGIGRNIFEVNNVVPKVVGLYAGPFRKPRSPQKESSQLAIFIHRILDD